MDVDLATPDAASLDTGLSLTALGLVGYGAYRLFAAVGTEAGLVGWLFVAAGWLLVFPHLFLELSLTDETIEAGVVTGSRSVDLADVRGARIVDGLLVPRLGGVAAARYHCGRFRLLGEGPVRAYASRARGPFVVLERADAAPLVLSPADPEAFLREVSEGTGLG